MRKFLFLFIILCTGISFADFFPYWITDTVQNVYTMNNIDSATNTSFSVYGGGSTDKSNGTETFNGFATSASTWTKKYGSGTSTWNTSENAWVFNHTAAAGEIGYVFDGTYGDSGENLSIEADIKNTVPSNNYVALAPGLGTSKLLVLWAPAYLWGAFPNWNRMRDYNSGDSCYKDPVNGSVSGNYLSGNIYYHFRIDYMPEWVNGTIDRQYSTYYSGTANRCNHGSDLGIIGDIAAGNQLYARNYRVRKFIYPEPVCSYGSNESGEWSYGGENYTWRINVTCSATKTVTDYTLMLDYLQFNDTNLLITNESLTSVAPETVAVNTTSPQNTTYNTSNILVNTTCFGSLPSYYINITANETLLVDSDTAYNNTPYTYTQNFSNGYWPFNVSCWNDTAFNWTDVNFTVNDTAPTVTLIFPTNNSYFGILNSSVTFVYTASDTSGLNLTCNLYVNDTLNDTYTVSTTGNNYRTGYGIDIGLHDWYVSCTDSGNLTTNTSAWYFTVIENRPWPSGGTSGGGMAYSFTPMFVYSLVLVLVGILAYKGLKGGSDDK